MTTMKERIAACEATILGKTNPQFSAEATLFSASLSEAQRRASRSVLDENGVRVLDKKDGNDVNYFICLVDKCGDTAECYGKKIFYTTSSTSHGTHHPPDRGASPRLPPDVDLQIGGLAPGCLQMLISK
jgi:hypothetical protein